MKLDSLDRNLLIHLQKDARLSLRELGRLLNVPHTTVFTRVNKLVDKGIIRKFQAILHPHELGLKIGMVVIEPPPTAEDPIAEQVADMDQIMKVFKTDEGRIFAKAVWDPEDTDSLKAIEGRLYGYEYTIHQIGEVIKYEHNLHDDLVECIK